MVLWLYFTARSSFFRSPNWNCFLASLLTTKDCPGTSSLTVTDLWSCNFNAGPIWFFSPLKTSKIFLKVPSVSRRPRRDPGISFLYAMCDLQLFVTFSINLRIILEGYVILPDESLLTVPHRLSPLFKNLYSLVFYQKLKKKSK